MAVLGSTAGRSANANLHYMSAPLSIRFDDAILDRLRRRMRALPGSTPPELAQRLVDEGLRMLGHPGVLFTSHRTFPRSRRMFGSIVTAPGQWMDQPDAGDSPPEDSLRR
jgi:hypothetical protein